ncbi:MAG: S26 family signal peptidase [Bifidobacteriaceae bacterium]|jgi:hypothetical protein|nr:S26 family signal peptidase [Bifidobacteriaceae bacterium]
MKKFILKHKIAVVIFALLIAVCATILLTHESFIFVTKRVDMNNTEKPVSISLGLPIKPEESYFRCEVESIKANECDYKSDDIVVIRDSYNWISDSGLEKFESRILGIPGDRVTIYVDGTIAVNAQFELSEARNYTEDNYVKLQENSDLQEESELNWLRLNETREDGEHYSYEDLCKVDQPFTFALGEDEYFVRGDNVVNAVDSRTQICSGKFNPNELDKYNNRLNTEMYIINREQIIFKTKSKFYL